MDEVFVHERSLLAFFDLAQIVFSGLDDNLEERGNLLANLGAVGSGQDPALVDEATTAEVSVGPERWKASLEGHLVRKLAGLGIVSAYQSWTRSTLDHKSFVTL